MKHGLIVPTVCGFTDYVWHQGRTWRLAPHRVAYQGRVSLESWTQDGVGISALPEEIYNCTAEEMEAIRDK